MYDAMVGAGTYIFSLDGDRNVDATRTGNIAHLLNHSCKPNCFTRIVYAAGQSRVVIFALRDLKVSPALLWHGAP
jgi:SET domain-containing protein